MSSSAWMEINLTAWRNNLRAIQKELPANCQCIAVVKADAYGHGLTNAVSVARDCGLQTLAVAHVAEGVALRHLGWDKKILVMSDTPLEDLVTAVDYRLTLVVDRESKIQALQTVATVTHQTASVHLKVDLGLGRFGCSVSDVPALCGYIYNCSHVDLTGVFGHLQYAENPKLAKIQAELFEEATKDIPAHFKKPGFSRHLCNSAGLVTLPTFFRYDAVRIGLLAYGHLPVRAERLEPSFARQFYPVMSVKAKIVTVREAKKNQVIGYGMSHLIADDTWLAVVPIGYGDGYPSTEGPTQVSIGGRCVDLAGKAMMDCLLVDTNKLGRTPLVGEEVTLLGEGLPLSLFSKQHGRNPRDVLCCWLPRLKRRAF